MSLINISHLTFGYDNGFGNVFEDVSFQIDTDWKLGFIGRNGRGKTTFLNLLMGKYEYSGTISASVCFDYFPYSIKDESRDTLDIIEHIVPDYELWLLQKELSLLDVEEEVLYRPFATLSNGERTKVLLASLFLQQNHFLLIDEPTNHLDAEGRRLVADYLNGKKGFILVSHDRNFLDRCVDHTLSINRRNIEIQRGNFSSWQKNKQMQDEYELAENERLKKDVKKLSAAAKRTADWSEKTEKSKVGQKKTERKCAVHDRGFIGHKAAKIMKRSKTLEARQQSAIEEKSTLLKNIDSADSLALRSLRYPQETLIEASDLSLFYGDKSVCTSVRFTVNRG
ncbi:MAG: ABC-F family ATP-binding cassette domain-containing protein, partial [Synergistaceae bacterium]|nr:ABC-F family ATP-binding cassette domain-containing protein [Synergistaceae bacterium]